MNSPDRVIGGYTLRRVLGCGGMGEVHLASTPAGGLAAVKVIHPQLARDPAFRRRFDREVAAARRVARFCTAPVLDAGMDGDVAYLVTEYVKGPDLAQAVRDQGPLQGSNLEALAVGIATALNAIHGAGVIHRDLKPSNVLLSPLGPRVIDFGIAQLVDADSLASQSILGTPAFMAPEQVRGEPLGPSVDVYAWGGVIAFAGTGRLPFGGGAPAEVLYRIVNEGPYLEGLDERLRALIERAMAKDPARRPDARELLAELVGGQPSPESATQAVERTWTTPVAAPIQPWTAQHQTSVQHQSGGHAQAGGHPQSVGHPQISGHPGSDQHPQPGGRLQSAGRPQAGAYPQSSEHPRSAEAAGQASGAAGPWALQENTRLEGASPAPRARRRRWPWVAGLVAVVVVAVAVPFVVTQLNEPTWPYRAGFAESWAIGSTDGGTAARSGSAYLLTANPGWRLWKSAPVAEPDEGVVVSARARIEEGSGDFGVWCRGTTGGDRYEFAVTGAGKASITKRRAGQKPVVLFGPADVKTSRDSSIVAECKTDGEKVALGLTVNGDKVGQASDADRPYAPGGTGVHAAPDDGKPLRVRFASFTVQPVKRATATGLAFVGSVRRTGAG